MGQFRLGWSVDWKSQGQQSRQDTIDEVLVLKGDIIALIGSWEWIPLPVFANTVY